MGLHRDLAVGLGISIPFTVVIVLLFFKFKRVFTARRRISQVHITNKSSSMSGNLVVEKKDVPITHVYYLSKNRLGRGSSAEVVIGTHIQTRRKYAIKIIDVSSTRSSSRKLIERYEREKNLLRDVDHTNIIRLYEVYCGEYAQYFVMELCTGGHLGE